MYCHLKRVNRIHRMYNKYGVFFPYRLHFRLLPCRSTVFFSPPRNLQYITLQNAEHSYKCICMCRVLRKLAPNTSIQASHPLSCCLYLTNLSVFILAVSVFGHAYSRYSIRAREHADVHRIIFPLSLPLCAQLFVRSTPSGFLLHFN